MTVEIPEPIDLGEGLSLFSVWDNSRINPVLWFFLLFLNALYTLIGVRLRDLRPNGACELNVNRTIGIIEHDDQVGLFWGLLSLYLIVSIVIVMVEIVVHVLHCCKDYKTARKPQQGYPGVEIIQVQIHQRDQGGPINKRVQLDLGVSQGRQNVIEILHIVLVNTLVIISGILYIAADNFFFLVDPDDQNQNPSTTRSFIAGSSFICSVIVVVIDKWFEHSVYKCLKTCKCCTCKYCEGIDECFEDSVLNKCLETCQSCGKSNPCKSNKNENGVISDRSKTLKILYFWSPFAGLITIFDSLFISVVDEISGEESVRNGIDCSNERGIEGAIIFYIAICSAFFISIGIIVAFKMINKTKYLPKECSSCEGKCSCNWKWKRRCVYFWYPVYYFVTGIVFVITGLMFIVADNNWPWICLAKKDSDICSWVIVRVGFLAAVTVLSILFLLFSAALSIWQCQEKLNPAESDNTNEGFTVRFGVTIEQTNTAATSTEICAPSTTEEGDTMDIMLTVNLKPKTYPEADANVKKNVVKDVSIEF